MCIASKNNNEPIQNCRRDVTVKHTEKLLRQQNGVKYNESENRNDNFTVELSFLFYSENSIIHSYLYYKGIIFYELWT